jgi:phosphorylcholine metabolism protein LicD
MTIKVCLPSPNKFVLDLVKTVKDMRTYFIRTVDQMQDKFETMVDQSKRERQLLLDIIKLEQKPSWPKSNVTFTEPAQFQQISEQERGQTPSQDQSSMSIQIDPIDENNALYIYEINLNRKAIEDLHVKLVDLTAELEVILNVHISDTKIL